MSSHGLVKAIAVTDPIDGVNNAIDVQVAKNQSDLEQEIVILSQLHVINLQWLHDLDRLAVRWNTTDVCSLCQGECESAEDEHTCSLWWFSVDKSKIKDVAAPKDVDQHRDSTDQYKSSPPCWLQWSGNWHVCFSKTMTSSQWFAPHLPFDRAFSSASYQLCDWSPRT